MKSLMAWDTPPRIDEQELIDDETQPYADLRASMGDVRNANRLLGGTQVVTRQVRRWLRAPAAPAAQSVPITFLDVATGTADLPLAILATAARDGIGTRIFGLDYSAQILRAASEVAAGSPAIQLIRGTAFRLPFRDASVDYAICSLAFHHFGFEKSVRALREMERVARRGWLVNDLRRARSAWYLFRAVAALARMNRLTRHDGPASILRAYSVDEYLAMPAALGLREGTDFRLERSLFYRVALVRDKPPAG
ncbi:MAG TPA: methyltransferase domain-containing protein [Chthonomonadaceae bacterium]|nr:methyltransferase domain-containing protein [Chthonomonadaceae bacterium]